MPQQTLHLVEEGYGPESVLDSLSDDALFSKPEIASPDEVSVYIHEVPIDDQDSPVADEIHNKSPLIIREVVPADRSQETGITGSVVFMHGLTQLADMGPSAALQELYALDHPDKRVLAIETDGMGEFSDGLSLCKPEELASYTLAEMAARRLEFLRTLSTEDEPTTVISTSMGSIITMMALNLAKEKKIPLHLDKVIFNDSAIIPEQGLSRLARMGKFPLHMVATLPWQLANTPLKEKAEMLKVGLGALRGVGAKDLLAMGRQTLDLVFGSDHPDADEITEILANFPDTHFFFMSGVLDPLRDASLYSKLAKKLKNVHVRRIGLAAHGRSVDSRTAEKDISRVTLEQYPKAA